MAALDEAFDIDEWGAVVGILAGKDTVALVLGSEGHGLSGRWERDANVRAVWLFSRNDAIGNAAVVVAAGLVTWTGTVWPDLVVALVIAGLFLHSSWSIIRDARADLREAR